MGPKNGCRYADLSMIKIDREAMHNAMVLINNYIGVGIATIRLTFGCMESISSKNLLTHSLTKFALVSNLQLYPTHTN